MFKLDIYNDAIYISDRHGEIVCWVEDEWIEDPELVAVIANAIKILYEKGPDVLRRTIGKTEVD